MTTRPLEPPPTDPGADALPDQTAALEGAGALARASIALRQRLEEVPTGDAAWAHYAETVEAAVFRLQIELVLAGAHLSAERAHDHEEVHGAVTTASELGRQAVDTLRVRAHLGRLDAEGLAEGATSELERMAGDLHDASRRVQQTTTASLSEARHGAAVAIRGVVAVFRAATAAAAPDDVAPPNPER